MARTAPTRTAALAVAAGAEEPSTSPLSARTQRKIAAALDAARADIAAAVAQDGVTATAAALRLSRSTLKLWRAPGGWLHGTQPPARGDE